MVVYNKSMIEFVKRHPLSAIFIIILIIIFAGVNQRIAQLEKRAQMEMENTRRQVELCKKNMTLKKYTEAISCYSDLVEKYENLEFRYGLGIAFIKKKRYGEALEEFKFIIAHKDEVEDEKLLEDSKKQIALIKKRLSLQKQAKKQDIGHYYSDTKDFAVWKTPKNIKVYINDSYGKAKLLKKAFDTWDKMLYGTLDFTYVDSSEDCDISATAIDIVDLLELAAQQNRSANSIGMTLTQTYYYSLNKDKVYMEKAEVMVSYNDKEDVERDDVEFLSIALHEVGHSIGILSHSKKYGDIMYPDETGDIHEYCTLSNRDINTAKKLYGNI